jgi:hypothetical protein
MPGQGNIGKDDGEEGIVSTSHFYWRVLGLVRGDDSVTQAFALLLVGTKLALA